MSNKIDAPDTVWVAKYALSAGKVYEAPVKSARSWEDGSVYVHLVGGTGYDSHKLGRDVHATREGAVLDANARRLKKIASLTKHIKKLEAMSFDV